MSNNYFQFKRFRIGQAGAAMKVGTDGVILGAWADVEGERILDIGAGTGLIALMAAQRRPESRVDAIEPDRGAFLQAEENVRQSPWSDRIALFDNTLQCFREAEQAVYDRIVSNPPYFIASLKNPDGARSAARHADSLPCADLAAHVARLLKPGGKFSVILPHPEARVFVATAATHGLYRNRKLNVIAVPGGPVKRVAMEFSFDEGPLQENEMVIESHGRHGYSEEYKALTRDFYLNF